MRQHHHRVRRVATAAALIAVLIGFGAPGAVAQVGAPASGQYLTVTPSMSPALVAARLSSMPAGSRTLLLSGFDYDIALRDRLSLSGGSQSPAIVIPSPWPAAGATALQGRVAAWLRALGPRAPVDAVLIAPPSAAMSSQLSRTTFPYLQRIAADKRFTSLTTRHPSLVAAIRSGSSVTAGTAWRSALRSELEAASLAAHGRAIRSVRPGVTFGPQRSISVIAPPSASGTSSIATDTAPNAGTVATAPAQAVGVESRPLASSEQVAVAAAAGYLQAKGVGIDLARAGSVAREGGAVSNWDRLFEAASTNAAARKILDDAVLSADRIVAMDASHCYRRPLRFDDIPPAQVDSIALGAGVNRDARALAMSDCRQSDFLRTHGVTLALAVRRAGRPEHVARMMDILSEVTQWIPLQRPGWSLGTPSSVLPVGGDGVNMATSWGVTGIVDVLSILGDRVPAELRAQLETVLRRELGSIVDSWASARGWYVGSDAVVSNQWIDPNAAAIHAYLFLKDPRLAPIYELAVANLLRSLGGLQPDGAFLEGVTYAQMSLPSVFRAAARMSEHGDTRAQTVPFIRNSWKWMLAMQMPGGNLVSACDSRMSTVPTWAMQAPLDSFALAAVASGDPAAIPSLRALFPACGSWSSAAAYAVSLSSVDPLPSPAVAPWSYFPSQQLVTWREGWAPPADQSREIGIWIKGGSLLERSHGQRDQGQVSIYCGATPILLERGTPDYGDPAYLPEYASARGHGIMQVDPLFPPNKAVDAPAAIQRLDASGGCVRLNLRAAYRSANSCERSVTWDRGGPVVIADSVAFADWKPAGTELYRFHLGASAPPELSLAGGIWTVAWEDATMHLAADGDVVVELSQSSSAIASAAGGWLLTVTASRPTRGLNLSTRVDIAR